MFLFRFYLMLSSYLTVYTFNPGHLIKTDEDLKSKTISGEVNSLMTGRIISSGFSKNKQNLNYSKNSKICLTSNKKLGLCKRLSQCKSFSIATLRENLCIVELFVPGVCCETVSLPSFLTSTLPTSTMKIEALKENNETKPQLVQDIIKEVSMDCGKQDLPSSSRIVNGQVSENGKWPWVAAIYVVDFVARRFHCGGSLISDQHVLTGAHCVKNHWGKTFAPSLMSVRLGDNDIRPKRNDARSARFYSVKEIRAHPNFQNINHYFLNDVAVIKLNDKVDFTNFVFPICLPTSSIMASPLDTFAGRFSTVIGYGKTNLGILSKKLLEAEVPIWKNKDCDRSYFAPITDKFICAGFKKGGTDACQGDSGGPLQIQEKNRWFQIGITSFGKGCGEPGFPGVYTRVSKFTTWIKNNMN